MVGNCKPLTIIREEDGHGTGDRRYQTSDGRWWKTWDGIVKTGEEVRIKKGDIVE